MRIGALVGLSVFVLACGGPGGSQSDGGGGDDGGLLDQSTPVTDSSTPQNDGSVVVPTSLIDPSRITEWNPGILADDLLKQPLGPDGLPQRTKTCATLSPGGNIQSAIDACPSGQVVQLAAGTYNVASTIHLKSGV